MSATGSWEPIDYAEGCDTVFNFGMQRGQTFLSEIPCRDVDLERAE